jgi:hypothetical protein
MRQRAIGFKAHFGQPRYAPPEFKGDVVALSQIERGLFRIYGRDDFRISWLYRAVFYR